MAEKLPASQQSGRVSGHTLVWCSRSSPPPAASAGATEAQPNRAGVCRFERPTGTWNPTVKMSDDEQEQTIAEDLVVTKYKMSGDIANRELTLGRVAPSVSI